MRHALLMAGIALSLTWHGVARAQTRDDLARADALFNAAKALTDSGQYADACAKFAESKRLAPGLGVTLYLADCYERIGKTASAWAEFRSAEGQARERSDRRAEVARTRAQSLEPKLERLTITVAPTVSRTGLEVLRDGVPVSQDELGLPVPVDPGEHVVVVSSLGHARRTFSRYVGPDRPTASIAIESVEENVTPAPTTPTAPSAAPALPETPNLSSPSEDRGMSRRWIGIGVGGAGVVGTGVGAAFGWIAKSKFDQSNSGPCNSTDHCTGAGLSMRKDAESSAMVSTIAFVGGGIALAAGVVLYVTAPRRPSSSGWRIAPVPLAKGAGAVLGGDF